MAMESAAKETRADSRPRIGATFLTMPGISRVIAQRRLRATAERIPAAAEKLVLAECQGAPAVLPVMRKNYDHLQLLRWQT